MVAAIFIAATFIVFPSVSEAKVHIIAEGVREWQRELAVQTLTEVEEGIPDGHSVAYQSEILRAVASRLFSGYRINTLVRGAETIVVKFETEMEPPSWKVVAAAPVLRELPLEWFNADSANMSEEIELLLRGVPLEALSWSDRAFQGKVDEIVSARLPGWGAELLVTRGEGEAIMTVSFVPQMPLILAVNPTLTSNSLPTLLHGELREDLMGRFAPFVGLPVEWTSKHSAEFSLWVEDYINERSIVERSFSEAKAEFRPSQISNLDVRIESRHYTLNAWAAVYAGTSDKSAEVGLHIGRKVELLPNVDMEAYAEGLLGLQEWNINGRFGLRWRSVRGLWLGGEWDTEDDMWWLRLSMDPQLHKPYIWLRLNEEGSFNGALGWKATEYISFEVEYDARDDDRWSLKMLGNL